MAKDELDITGTDAPSGSRMSKKNIIIFAGLLLVAVGASIGGTVFVIGGQGGEHEGEGEATEEVVNKAPLYMELEPAFQVNFMAGNKPRVLQAELAVMTRDQLILDAITTHAPIVRNRLIDLLSKQDFVEMQTDAGRKALMAAAKATIDGVLEEEGGHPGVEQVLITSFVMQ